MKYTMYLTGIFFLGTVSQFLAEDAPPNSKELRALETEMEKLVRAVDPQTWRFDAKLWRLELKLKGESPHSLATLALEIKLTNISPSSGDLLDDQAFAYEIVVTKADKEKLALTEEGEKLLHLPDKGRIVHIHRYIIPPSQSEIKTVDLAKLFLFSGSGKYSVRVDRYENVFRSHSSSGTSLDFVIE